MLNDKECCFFDPEGWKYCTILIGRVVLEWNGENSEVNKNKGMEK